MQVKVPTSYMPSNGMTQVKASSTWKFILRSCRNAEENKTNIVRAHTHRNVSHTHSMHGSTPSSTERERNKKLTSLRTMMRVKLSAQTIYISMGWHCRLSALAQVFVQDTQREEKRRKKSGFSFGRHWYVWCLYTSNTQSINTSICMEHTFYAEKCDDLRVIMSKPNTLCVTFV